MGETTKLRSWARHIRASENRADTTGHGWDRRRALTDAADYLETLAVEQERTDYETVLAAISGVSEDYMTSEVHHPGYVLIPVNRFEKLRAAEALIGGRQ